jgi:hypothetical protein
MTFTAAEYAGGKGDARASTAQIGHGAGATSEGARCGVKYARFPHG